MTAVALEAVHARVSRTTLLATTVAVVVTLVAWWAAEPYVVGVWHDDGVYALLGRAIADGHGFRHLQLPGAPAAVHYPPLYPLLLAALWRLAPSFPDNIAVFLAANALLVGAAAVGACRFLRHRLGWRDDAAALVAVLGTVATPVLALAGALLSESLFLALLWPALLLADRSADDQATAMDALAAGAATGLLMLVRTHAVALLAAVLVVHLVRRRMLLAASALGAAVLVVLPWQVWTLVATPTVAPPLAGAYGSYLGWMLEGVRGGGASFVAATARVNLRELWLLLQDRVVTGGGVPSQLVATTAFIAILLAGAVRLLRRSPVFVAFLAAYLAVVLVWPYAPWRFVWAVWPLLIVCAAAGCQTLAAASKTRPRAALAALVLLPPSYGMARTEWDAYRTRAWTAPARAAGAQITPIVAWVGANTKPADLVLAEGEQVVSLFTGRRAAPTASFSADEYLHARSVAAAVEELRAMLALAPARFVLPLAPVQLEAARSLEGRRPGLRPVEALPGSVVFEVVR